MIAGGEDAKVENLVLVLSAISRGDCGNGPPSRRDVVPKFADRRRCS